MPQSTTEADVAAIRVRLAEVVEAHNTGDAVRWANLATEDAVFMPEGGPTVTGRSALLEWINAFYATARISNMRAEAIEIIVAEDWAISRDYFTASLTPSNGDPATVLDGKEIAVWKRQRDGSWRAARVFYNTNPPR